MKEKNMKKAIHSMTILALMTASVLMGTVGCDQGSSADQEISIKKPVAKAPQMEAPKAEESATILPAVEEAKAEPVKEEVAQAPVEEPETEVQEDKETNDPATGACVYHDNRISAYCVAVPNFPNTIRCHWECAPELTWCQRPATGERVNCPEDLFRYFQFDTNGLNAR